MMELLQFEFMRNAMLAGLLISLACGVIGAFVVAKRIVFVSGGIAHAAYGGIGLGYFWGINPVVGAIAFSLFAALGMGAVERKTAERADTIIGAMWAIGMAVGIIFVDLAPGYKEGLMSYLFGSILTVPRSDLWIMLALNGLILLLVTLFYKELLAISFDETFAIVQNVRVNVIYIVLLALIGFTVVMLMEVVGLIMVIALLTMPAAIAAQYVRGLKQMMVGATALSVLFTISGLLISYYLNLTSGATIILVAGTVYLFSLAVRPRLQRSLLVAMAAQQPPQTRTTVPDRSTTTAE
jgi:zinc transport system permease protein